MEILSEIVKSFGYVSQVLLAIYLLLGNCTSEKSNQAIFIFGDSLVDVGNNLYINTLAKPVSPNGIDFGTGGPSGRYTNGRTIPDLVVQELGFKNFTPPYLAPTTAGDVILKGVNYASSGAGILNETGLILGDRINLDTQISYFEKTKQDIISRIGRQAAENLLIRSIYVVVIGSNDIVSRRLNSFGRKLSSNAYTDDLMSRFRVQLTRLYNLGARKFIVASAPPLGCIPFQRDVNPPGDDCVASLNQEAQFYNKKLKGLLSELTRSNTISVYVYADVYAVAEHILQNYASYGFDIADFACCHLAGTHGGLIPCISGSQVCQDRTKYVFWDAFHPSEATNLIAVKFFMDGDSKFILPMNIRQLVNL